MGFESYRQGAFTKRLADLPDQPNMQAAELKTYFDSSPEELRQALNRLCDALGEFSAAAKLGYTASAGVPAQTVQDAIENVQKQVRDASVGKLPSGCVDGDTLSELQDKGLDVFRILQNNDAYHALQAVGGLIMTGPTGTNVNDVAVALLGAD